MNARDLRLLKALQREDRVNDLRDGRKHRHVTFRAAKGPGSYRRRPKHRQDAHER